MSNLEDELRSLKHENEILEIKIQSKKQELQFHLEEKKRKEEIERIAKRDSNNIQKDIDALRRQNLEKEIYERDVTNKAAILVTKIRPVIVNDFNQRFDELLRLDQALQTELEDWKNIHQVTVPSLVDELDSTQQLLENLNSSLRSLDDEIFVLKKILMELNKANPGNFEDLKNQYVHNSSNINVNFFLQDI